MTFNIPGSEHPIIANIIIVLITPSIGFGAGDLSVSVRQTADDVTKAGNVPRLS